MHETFTDFTRHSVHKTFGRVSNADYVARKPLDELPIPMQYGTALERFQHDTTHSQLLGTSKVLNGSVLTYLLEAGEYGEYPRHGIYEQSLSTLLRRAFVDFKLWCKTNKLQCTQPRFTCSRLNRKHRGLFPCLASKAINGKRVSFYLAEKAVGRSQREGRTFLDELVAVCAWSYCSMLRQMDQYGLLLSQAEASLLHEHGMLHLQCYAHLRYLSAMTKGKVLLRSSFPILPKHHYLQHCLEEALQSLINPGHYNLLAAESWVGTIGRISRNLALLEMVFLMPTFPKVFIHTPLYIPLPYKPPPLETRVP